MHIVPGTYCLDFPISIAAIYPWFYISLFKPIVSHSAGPPVLEDDFYEIEPILKTNPAWKKC